jgi:hypothetical protein
MATNYTKWPQIIPNGHKLYQMAINYTKWPQIIPNGHKLYQMAINYTKWPQIIPNGHKLYQMATKHTKWPQNIQNECKILQMDTKYANMFNSQALHNIHKYGFLVWKYTIWQPCFCVIGQKTKSTTEKLFHYETLNHCMDSCRVADGFFANQKFQFG